VSLSDAGQPPRHAPVGNPGAPYSIHTRAHTAKYMRKVVHAYAPTSPLPSPS
jgi:hypothetical protein